LFICIVSEPKSLETKTDHRKENVHTAKLYQQNSILKQEGLRFQNFVSYVGQTERDYACVLSILTWVDRILAVLCGKLLCWHLPGLLEQVPGKEDVEREKSENSAAKYRYLIEMRRS
jgi:hypothetical protein